MLSAMSLHDSQSAPVMTDYWPEFFVTKKAESQSWSDVSYGRADASGPIER